MGEQQGACWPVVVTLSKKAKPEPSIHTFVDGSASFLLASKQTHCDVMLNIMGELPAFNAKNPVFLRKSGVQLLVQFN